MSIQHNLSLLIHFIICVFNTTQIKAKKTPMKQSMIFTININQSIISQ